MDFRLTPQNQSTFSKVRSKSKRIFCVTNIRKQLLLVVVQILIITAVCVCITIALKNSNEDELEGEISHNVNKRSLIENTTETNITSGTGPLIGNRQNQHIKCPLISNSDISERPVFPNLEYITYGYNVLSAFPLAFGHDPGFTHPIFKVSYDRDNTNGDCTYSIPDGVHIVKEVTCSTEFNSETITSAEEYKRTLEQTVELSVPFFFGIKFSANRNYRKDYKSLANEESVLVFTSVKCQQFFGQIKTFEPPRFQDGFLRWLTKLNNSDQPSDYLDFASYYGTHFFDEMAFGASYTHEYSMSAASHKSMISRQINVNAEANFWAFNFNAKYSDVRNQYNTNEYFLKSVSTKLITRGTTPPQDGNATKWANQVFATPVPISQKLKPIDELFTDQFMGHIETDMNINYRGIQEKLMSVLKIDYPKEFFDRSSNIFCRGLKSGYKLPAKLSSEQASIFTPVNSSKDCGTKCLELDDCVVGKRGSADGVCDVIYRMDTTTTDTILKTKEDSSGKRDMVVFPFRMSTNYGWSNQAQWLWLTHITIGGGQRFTSTTLDDCKKKCIQDEACVAIRTITSNYCYTFSAEQIKLETVKFYNNENYRLGFIKIC